MLAKFILIIHMFLPNGGYAYERYPVEVPACADVDTAQCGIRVCLQKGRERAAVLWGRMPGSTFALQCVSPDGSEEGHEGTNAGGGHPALGFQ